MYYKNQTPIAEKSQNKAKKNLTLCRVTSSIYIDENVAVIFLHKSF